MLLAASANFSTAFIAKEPGDLQDRCGASTPRHRHRRDTPLLRPSQPARSRCSQPVTETGVVQTPVQIPVATARLTSSCSIFCSNTTATRATSVVIITTNSKASPLYTLQKLSLSPSYTALSGFIQKIQFCRWKS